MPVEPFDPIAVLIMSALALLGASLAMILFQRRDLTQ
jgi:hypothetical protein